MATLYHCTIVPLCLCTIVPLYQRNIVPLQPFLSAQPKAGFRPAKGWPSASQRLAFRQPRASLRQARPFVTRPRGGGEGGQGVVTNKMCLVKKTLGHCALQCTQRTHRIHTHNNGSMLIWGKPGGPSPQPEKKPKKLSGFGPWSRERWTWRVQHSAESFGFIERFWDVLGAELWPS